MLEILLLILKILGFTILALILIILALLMIILFIPIRYSIYGKHKDEIFIRGKLTWLFHIFYLNIRYEDGKIIIKIRIFGILVVDNTKVKKRRKQVKNNKKIQKSKRVKNKNNKVYEINRNKGNNKNSFNLERNENKAVNTDKESNSKNVEQKNYKKDRQINEDDISIKKASIKAKIIAIKDKIFSAWNGFIKIKDKVFSAWNGFIKIKDKIFNAWNGFMEVKDKISLINAFIKNEDNILAIKKIYKSTKKLFNHIKPRKVKSYTSFGTGDPCSTGQILGALSTFGIGLKKNIIIAPDFENRIFEGEHCIKGRIRIFILLIIIIKLIISKEIKKLKDNYNALKEAM